MAKVMSLFESQEEATQALDALYASEVANVEAEVIEQAGEVDHSRMGVVGTAHTISTGASGIVDVPTRLAEVDFANDDEAAWFTKGVQGGSVLVVAEVDDEDASTVEQLLQQHGGRTYDKT